MPESIMGIEDKVFSDNDKSGFIWEQQGRL